jgi:hypothetical protein
MENQGRVGSPSGPKIQARSAAWREEELSQGRGGGKKPESGWRRAESSGILKGRGGFLIKIRGRCDMATPQCSKAVSASATGDIYSQVREGGPLRLVSPDKPQRRPCGWKPSQGSSPKFFLDFIFPYPHTAIECRGYKIQAFCFRFHIHRPPPRRSRRPVA